MVCTGDFQDMRSRTAAEGRAKSEAVGQVHKTCCYFTQKQAPEIMQNADFVL
ncbi:hypothetical protein CLOM621_07879 [Clostridium sp. M62/1]|nr:hypothetical protein CLOM621_07879 [Clostridium sp. M62/1]